ncbi:MAG: hypothetical protein OEM82_09385 [Acidobacteriota bacterium]|nr:hypothetical protein [Acidobacteriota bacterium]MDH3528878.1 hypothetical protein [Acidobacteriota bacterium]
MDERGLVKRNILVSIIKPPCRGCIDWIVPTAAPLLNGDFLIAGKKFAKGERIQIYIVETLPDDVYNPFLPLDLTLGEFDEFKGLTVYIPETGEINLGNVYEYYSFVPVTIDLNSLNWPDQRTTGIWKDVRLSVSYKDKSVVDNARIDDRYLNQKSGNFVMAFPVGVWLLEFTSVGEVTYATVAIKANREHKVTKTCGTSRSETRSKDHRASIGSPRLRIRKQSACACFQGDLRIRRRRLFL